ncbi:3-hydroxyacyl-ACP dehydratase FabZ [Alphaproteobacteria bacterium]|nr:3-hydroxyacyl-ACP dehydratase FabZ [Alphaproteobacteria bacterium]
MIILLEEIKKLIPHRKPFLFIDACEIINLGEEGIGNRIFLEDEYFFKGHFPDMPIVPGVILIESMAQTAGIVVSKKYETYEDKSVLFMSVSKAKFRKPVYPNEKIFFHVKFINSVKSVYKFSGEAFKDNTKVCESEFSAMITHK